MNKITPENFQIIMGHEPCASNALADTSDWVCLKNAAGCLILVSEYTAGGDTDLVLTVHEGQTGTGTTAITTGAEFPIWVNEDATTLDTWTRQTDGLGYTIDATTTKNYLVAFDVKASVLSAGYDWIQLGSTGGNASNIVSVIYILYGIRYAQATPPTVLS